MLKLAAFGPDPFSSRLQDTRQKKHAPLRQCENLIFKTDIAIDEFNSP